jgi:hypothetical protein
MTKKVSAGLLFSAAFLLAAAAVRAQAPPGAYEKMAPLEQYLIADRSAEIALARSAAPASISKNASVLVLTPRGYVTAVEGTNGFVCNVERSWQSGFDDPGFWNPRLRGPVCMNAAAVRSVLPLQHRVTDLALSRLSREEILARMKEALAKKELGPPEIGSMSYMMSKEQYLGDGNGHWHPHLMFYVPGETNAAAWGANLPSSPVFGGGQDLPGGGRMPWAIFFVPVPRWSDGSAAEEHLGPQK